MNKWGLYDKKSGELMWWYDREGREQFEVFCTREAARSAQKEWREADHIVISRKVKVQIER